APATGLRGNGNEGRGLPHQRSDSPRSLEPADGAAPVGSASAQGYRSGSFIQCLKPAGLSTPEPARNSLPPKPSQRSRIHPIMAAVREPASGNKAMINQPVVSEVASEVTAPASPVAQPASSAGMATKVVRGSLWTLSGQGVTILAALVATPFVI